MWFRLKKMWFKKTKAQAITEYAVLLGIIILAIVLVQVYLKRSIQGKFKSTADDIGEQWTTGEDYTLQTVQQSARNETSGIGPIADLKNTWSRSEISDATKGAIPVIVNVGIPTTKLTKYGGHEITQRDFVIQGGAKGTGTLGKHGTFDSGQIGKQGVMTLNNEGE